MNSWWIPAVNASEVAFSLLNLALELGAGRQEIEAALAGKVNPSDVLWRRLAKKSRWLLVLDNADDTGTLAVGGRPAGDGNGWLRPAETGLVVVTSRLSGGHGWGACVEDHPLTWLPPEEGAQVLLDLARHAGSEGEAASLSTLVGGLPLALRHAGSHLASPFAQERSFAEYRDALSSQFSELMGGGSSDRETVTSTWELSLHQLAQQGRPQARGLLEVLAWFAPAIEIPIRLLDHQVLESVCDVDDRGAVSNGLSALLSVGLLDVRHDAEARPQWVVVHPLVAEVTRQRALASSEDRGLTHFVLVQRMLAGATLESPLDAGTWPSYSEIIPHVEHMIERHPECPEGQECCPEGFRELVLSCGHYLYVSGQYSRGRELMWRVWNHWKGVRGDRDPHVLSAANRLGSTLTELDENEQARDIFTMVHGHRRSLLGDDHKETLAVANNLAIALKNLKDYKAAREILAATLTHQCRVLGPNSPSSLRSASNLGTVLLRMQEYGEAYGFLCDVLERRQATLGPLHRETLWTEHCLALAMDGLGRRSDARATLLEVVAKYAATIGVEHPDTLLAQESLEGLSG